MEYRLRPWVSRSFLQNNNHHFRFLNALFSSSSSSSSCHGASMYILGPLSPRLHIVHGLRQVFKATSCILT